MRRWGSKRLVGTGRVILAQASGTCLASASFLLRVCQT